MIVLPDTKTFDTSIRLVQLVEGVTKVNMRQFSGGQELKCFDINNAKSNIVIGVDAYLDINNQFK